MKAKGTVYLIHFNEALKHARHYVGWTVDLDARLKEHRSGHGARLMAVINEAGITWRCVRTWPGGRKLERQLKNRKCAPRLCPICSGDAANNRANHTVARKATKPATTARPAQTVAQDLPF